MTSRLVAATDVRSAESRRFVIASAAGRAAIRSFLRGITDSFALCAQNDKPFSCCNRREKCRKPPLCYCERRRGAAIRSFSRGITDFFAYTEKAYSKKTAYSAVF